MPETGQEPKLKEAKKVPSQISPSFIFFRICPTSNYKGYGISKQRLHLMCHLLPPNIVMPIWRLISRKAFWFEQSWKCLRSEAIFKAVLQV